MKKNKKENNEWLLPPLKKHVAMIQVSNDITLLQRKLSNILLQNAFDELTVKDKHTISLGRLSERIGFNSKNIEYLQDSLRGLAKTTIEWNIVNENGKLSKSWGIASVLANCEIKDNIVTYSYGGVLSEKLGNPDFFARLDLRMQQRFCSTFGLALYENCLRYADIGHTAWFSVELLKKLLGAHKQDQYAEYYKFSERVLKKAVSEVNAVSDLQISPEFQREGRKVVAVKFSVVSNKQNALDLPGVPENADRDTDIKLRLQADFGISGKQITDVCSAYSCEYILAKMEYTRQYAQQNPVKNIRGFLLSALRDDYVTAETYVDRQKAASSKNKQQSQQAYLDIGLESAKENYSAIEKHISALSESAQSDLDKQFALSLPAQMRASFEKNGLKSRPIKALFGAFVSNQMLERKPV
jgi:hypothetical protein